MSGVSLRLSSEQLCGSCECTSQARKQVGRSSIHVLLFSSAVAVYSFYLFIYSSIHLSLSLFVSLSLYLSIYTSVVSGRLHDILVSCIDFRQSFSGSRAISPWRKAQSPPYICSQPCGSRTRLHSVLVMTNNRN